MIINRKRADNQRLFTGKELEGPWFGTDTLFVGGLVDYKAISTVLKTRPHIDHIYWGANFVTPIDVHTALQVARDFSAMRNTFEIADWTEFMDAIVEVPDDFYTLLKGSCLMVRIQERGSETQTNVGVFDSEYAQNHGRIWLKYENESGVYTVPHKSGTYAKWEQYDMDEDIL